MSKTIYAFETRARDPQLGGATVQWWASEEPECPPSAAKALTITENTTTMASRFPDCRVVFQELGLGSSGLSWEVEPFEEANFD